MAISLKIVTPEKIAYEATVAQVVLPTTQGEMGVLPGHIPILLEIQGGSLRALHADGRVERLAVDRGFAEVRNDTVAVLTEAAIDVQSVDLGAVAEARKRAEEAIANADKSIDPEELERLEAISRFAVFQEMARGGK